MPDTNRPRHFKVNGPFFIDAIFDVLLPPGAYPLVELTGPSGGGSPTLLNAGSEGPGNWQHPDCVLSGLPATSPQRQLPGPIGSRAL